MVKYKHSTTLDHEQLKSLINSMADAVIAIDAQKTVTLYNGATLNLLDVNTDIGGKDIRTILALKDENGSTIDPHKLISSITTSFVSRNIKLEYPNGETCNLYVSIAPVHIGYEDDETPSKGHVLLMRDITNEKSLEQERDEFISVVSHELRTPITVAEGNVSNAIALLEKENSVSDIVKKSLNDAHAQVVFLANIINDLATLSRAERGAITFEVEKVNINELISEINTAYAEIALKKGIKLIASVDPDLGLIATNRLYLKEILQNIIDNAIKYTEKGSVTITTLRKSNQVIFKITDTGHGISKSDKAKIFTKFFRSEDFHTRTQNGTGLGLYITDKLATIIHAKITLESEINQGSTFTVTVDDLSKE